ncbi:HEXXH motif domain-containing protein [Streptomyces goshikiensis]|uniref:HEXXH motif domain-containing protein n=2 Tax=Streptomyces goshikiensis TaxID=1942 RepID=UPI0036528992
MDSPGDDGRLTMPGHLFDELASGGGSAEAVAFLVRVERTRRLMLLGELLDRLDEHPVVVGSAGTAWRLIAEAAEVRPEAAEALLMSPQVGCWITHMLRRLHGTADGPPLWADAGHLFAVCLVARLRAGLDADVVVPLRDGALTLPTLGLVTVTEPGAGGFATARARLRGGELRLSGGGSGASGASGGDVVVRPLDGAPTRHWTPARTFAGTSTWLDDLDPYRGLDEPVAPRPLPDAQAAHWQRLFGEAAGILSRPSTTGPGRLRVEEVRRIVPWTGPPAGPAGADRRVPGSGSPLSATTADAFGSMVVSRPGDGLALAEAMVHEFQHSKLGALLHLFPLLDDDGAEVHYAPWRSDPRHAAGLLQGAYAFTGVTGFWRDRMADGTADPERAAFQFALRRLQTRLVVRTLLTRAKPTGPGTRLLHGLAATLDAWLREPVAPGVAARARAAALAHRVEWRLRNLRCGEAERAALTTAFRAGTVPPPPSRYQPVLGGAGDPGGGATAGIDPHGLSDRLLAVAGGSPARRALLRRPERLLALAPGTPEELRRAADWLLLRA